MAGGLSFSMQFGRGQRRARPSNDSGFRILLLGDFSGRAGGAMPAGDLGSRRSRSVDVDNFDAVLASIAPCLQLRMGAAADVVVDLAFRTLDDFHPDRLYADCTLFKALRETRARLQDTATFASAAQGLRQVGLPLSATAPAEPAGRAANAEDDGATLGRLLGGAPAGPAPAGAPARHDPVGSLIRSVVAPYIVPDAPPHQAQYVAAVEAAITDQMRAVLHHPAFQSLEATWRALRWLIAEVEVGESLQVHLLDVSPAELRADMQAAQGDLERSALYRLLVGPGGRPAGAERWSMLAGVFSLAKNAADLRLLEFLGGVAAQVGAPLVVDADASFAGCESLVATPDPRDWVSTGVAADVEEHWRALRKSPVAAWIGLALPRVLLRMPYGGKTDQVSAFPFEEPGVRPAHDEFLWGSAAVGCALLNARAFVARGWDMEPGDELDLEDLPAYVREVDGDKHLLPAAEAWLGERAIEALTGAGLIAFASMKNRNAVRVPRMQSVAEPSAPLAGPWEAA